jgi:hypothetical protein
MDKFFEIATKISNQWSLAAFAIAGVVAMVLRLSGKRVPRVAWAVVLAVVVLATVPILAPIYLNNLGLYRVRITVTRKGTPAQEADVKCSGSGEVLKTGSGWECDVPAKTRPAGGLLTVYAADRSAFLRGSETLKLENDYAPAVSLSLEPDLSATINGSVLDDAEPGKPVAGAHIHIVGHESEGVVTTSTGDFTLKAHAADGQQVKLAVACEGYEPFFDWRQAGSMPTEIRLVRDKGRRSHSVSH